jgi:uncharacterized membrane protein YfcA
MDVAPFPSLALPTLILGIAFLYSSVGFGGASGYLAAMSLFAISPQVMASTALTLNVLVASLAFVAFYRAGHLNWRLLWPFLITSIPAAFVGGYLRIDERFYLILLNVALTYVAIRMLFNEFFTRPIADSAKPESFPLHLALIAGLGIGLLSGMIGVGGGIFLAPLIVVTGWGTVKQAAAVAAAFILLNSMSGIAGRWAADQYEIGALGLLLLPAGFVGGMAGSRLGARYLSGAVVRRLLGVVLLIAVLRLWLTAWA